MPFPRMTRRWWMIAVALLPLAPYGWIRTANFHRRARRLSARGDLLAMSEELCRTEIALCRSAVETLERAAAWRRVNPSLTADERSEVTRFVALSRPRQARQIGLHKQLSYYAGLKQKYLRAARRPWLPIAPDLPPP